MVAIKNILIFVGAASAAVLPRATAAQVETDLKTIDSDVKALTSAVNSWSGSIFTASSIENAANQLDSDIKKANTDASSATFTETDAKTIIAYINNTLEPDVKTAIAALEAKKSQAQADGLDSTVENELKTLKSDTDTLGNTLVTKTPADQQSAAKAALAKIDADFQGAINDYSS